MVDNPLSSGAAWIEDKIVPIADAKISVLDWGLTRSDITYDVVPVWDGAFFRIDDYLDRFEASVRSFRLEIPQSRDEIAKILHDTVAATGLKSAYVSMVASRGVPSIPGTRDPRLCNNHFYAWVVPYVWVIKPEVIDRGVHLYVSERARRIAPDSVDPTVKNYHWGDMTGALFEALDAQYDTTVLLDADNNVTEGPGFNIFAISDGKVVTPASGVLEGITRKTALEICEQSGFDCEIRDVKLAELLDAEEVFITTSGGGVIPVVEVNNRVFGNGKPGVHTANFISKYWKMHNIEKYRTDIYYKLYV